MSGPPGRAGGGVVRGGARDDAPGGGGVLARVPSPALILTGIATTQVGAALAVTLFAQVGPVGLALLRLSFASVILLVWWRPPLRNRSRHDLMLAAAFGLIFAGMNTGFYLAIHRIPLGIAVSIEFLGPLAVAIGGSRRAIDVLWALLAAGGIVALSHGNAHGLDATGVLLAVFAGVCWAAYILLNARVGRAFEGSTGLALATVVAAVVVLPFGLGASGARILQPEALLVGAAVGLLSSAIPYSFETEALRRMSVSLFGVLMSIEPAMAALAGLIVLGQGLSAREVIGIGLVVAASTGASLRAREAAVGV